MKGSGKVSSHRIDLLRPSFVFLASILLAFVLWPLLKTMGGSLGAPLWQTAIDPEVGRSILLTLFCSAIATLIALILGVPLAYLLARYDFRGKPLLEGIIELPIVVPHSAAGIALLTVFGRRAPLGRLFELVGIRFVGTAAGIVIAMLFVSLPFLVSSAREGFEAVDPRLERVARTLGATSWIAFRRISLPLAWRAILAGIVLMWARGISEFGAVIVLAYHPMVAPVLLYERFESYGLEYARPVAALMILICFAVFAVFRAIIKRRGANG